MDNRRDNYNRYQRDGGGDYRDQRQERHGNGGFLNKLIRTGKNEIQIKVVDMVTEEAVIVGIKTEGVVVADTKTEGVVVVHTKTEEAVMADTKTEEAAVAVTIAEIVVTMEMAEQVSYFLYINFFDNGYSCILTSTLGFSVVISEFLTSINNIC